MKMRMMIGVSLMVGACAVATVAAREESHPVVSLPSKKSERYVGLGKQLLSDVTLVAGEQLVEDARVEKNDSFFDSVDMTLDAWLASIVTHNDVKYGSEGYSAGRGSLLYPSDAQIEWQEEGKGGVAISCGSCGPNYHPHHWALPMSLFINFSHEAYDQFGAKKTLTQSVFGNDGVMRLRDIYLVSRLSDDGKLHRENEATEGGATSASFPNLREQQWLALLASMQISFDALEQRELSAQIATEFRFPFDCDEKIVSISGISIPVKTKHHSINFNLKGGTLFGPPSADPRVSRVDSLGAFFSDYSDVEDFFIRGVLEPKGIAFEPRQRKTGFGDISLFTSIDIAGVLPTIVDSLQFGINLVMPTGGKPCGNQLWEVTLGNGLFQADFFAQLMLTTCWSFFNPLVRCSIGVSPSQRVAQRVPVVKRHTHVASLATDLATNNHAVDLNNPFIIGRLTELIGVPPVSFGAPNPIFTKSFEEIDSLVPAFADSAFVLSKKQGSSVLFSCGNYCYDVFNVDLRFGLFYDYYSQSRDVYDCGKCLDVAVVARASDFIFDDILKRSEVTAHSLGWNLSYKFENYFEVGMGSHHMLAGRNTVKNHEVFLTFVSVF